MKDYRIIPLSNKCLCYIPAILKSTQRSGGVSGQLVYIPVLADLEADQDPIVSEDV